MPLANDVPMGTPEWARKPISLPEYLDLNITGEDWGKRVVAYHLTKTDNVEAIRRTGLRGSTCASHISSGEERPYAVYLFCSKEVLNDNARALFGTTNGVTALTIVIPADQTGNLWPDHLYNISVSEAYMSAMQYRGDIPAEWIK